MTDTGNASVAPPKTVIPASYPPLPFVAGSWYPSLYTASVANTPTTGQLSAVPFIVTAQHTFTALGVQCTTLGTAPVVRMGIYADNGGTPVGGALVLDAGTVAVGAIGNVTIAINEPLAPGLYWLVAVQVSATAGASFNRAGGSFSLPPLGTNAPSVAGVDAPGFISTATTFIGGLPATFPAATLGSAFMTSIQA